MPTLHLGCTDPEGKACKLKNQQGSKHHLGSLLLTISQIQLDSSNLLYSQLKAQSERQSNNTDPLCTKCNQPIQYS